MIVSLHIRGHAYKDIFFLLEMGWKREAALIVMFLCYNVVHFLKIGVPPQNDKPNILPGSLTDAI